MLYVIYLFYFVLEIDSFIYFLVIKEYTSGKQVSGNSVRHTNLVTKYNPMLLLILVKNETLLLDTLPRPPYLGKTYYFRSGLGPCLEVGSRPDFPRLF